MTTIPQIEAIFEVQKRILLAERYRRLRYELGIDVCLMLSMEEYVSDNKIASSHYTTQPENLEHQPHVRTIHNTKTTLILTPPRRKRRIMGGLDAS